jgi:hypothetical protein
MIGGDDRIVRTASRVVLDERQADALQAVWFVALAGELPLTDVITVPASPLADRFVGPTAVDLLHQRPSMSGTCRRVKGGCVEGERRSGMG